MSFRRKLTALGHPNPDKFDITNSEQSKHMVVWLEDQKIRCDNSDHVNPFLEAGGCDQRHDSRHYSIDDRAGLRNIASSEWQSCYDKYLRDLACPIVSDKDGNSDSADHNVIKDDEEEEMEGV